MSATAPVNFIRSEISCGQRFASTGTTTAPEKRHAACATTHSYEFSPRMPIFARGA